MSTELLAGPVARAIVREPLHVKVATALDATAWDVFTAGQPHAGYHRWAWRQVFERAFGHDCLYLMALRGLQVEGVLPLVAIRSRLFGRTLTSLPFLNYGGVRAADETAARALLDAAREQAADLGFAHIELRHTTRLFPEAPAKQHKVAMLLPIRPGMWEDLDRKVRNQVRKAEKSGLTVALGGHELLPEFYTVFSRNMRDLGTPVYSPKVFAEVLAAFPHDTRIHVVRQGHTAVAAGLTYRSGNVVEVPWASSVRDYNHLCPNHLLYWHVIETAAATGGELLDFGRSTPHEGTYKFKQQWGAEPLPLHWEYLLLAGGELPDQSPKNPKFRVAIELWKRCPLWLANAAGPHIVRMIP